MPGMLGRLSVRLPGSTRLALTGGLNGGNQQIASKNLSNPGAWRRTSCEGFLKQTDEEVT